METGSGKWLAVEKVFYIVSSLAQTRWLSVAHCFFHFSLLSTIYLTLCSPWIHPRSQSMPTELMHSELGVWFIFFLIVPCYQTQWVFPTGDFTFIRWLILNTYQDALAQQSVPLHTFYNFPLTLTILFLSLCSSSSCPCLPPLPVLPWRHCQLCTGPVSLIRWSCRIISLPPS